MIITNRFVFIHLPKTGGTFVTRMIADLRLRHFGPLAQLPITRRVAGKLGIGFRNTNKHGGCSELPAQHVDKPILGCIRNPYAHYVSQFEFGYWRDHPRPWWDWAAIGKRAPRFPDVSFAEFVDISSSMFHRLPTGRPPEERIGFFTSEVIRCYFRDPQRSLAVLQSGDADDVSWDDAAFPVRLLHTERLNHDLHDALVDLGYARSCVAFILETPKVLPPNPKGRPRPWQTYYTDELAALVRHRDRYLFERFPEYDE